VAAQRVASVWRNGGRKPATCVVRNSKEVPRITGSVSRHFAKPCNRYRRNATTADSSPLPAVNVLCRLKASATAGRKRQKATYSNQKHKPLKYKINLKYTVFLSLDKVKSIPKSYQVQVKISSTIKIFQNGNN
jgi:hypothetical protein